MHPISLLVKPASGLCNMRCTYCFYCDEMQHRTQQTYGMMSVETLEQMIRKTFAAAQGSCTIAFQGGEPTLAGLDFFKSVVAFVRQYNTKQIPVQLCLQTNGLAITEEWALFLEQAHFLVGLSLDGLKKTHDIYRRDMQGAGTFDRVLETAALLRTHNVDFNLLTVVNSRTAQAVERIYAFYQKYGFAYQQYIPCLDPMEQTPGSCEYSLTPQIYGLFLCKLFDLWYADLRVDKQPYIREFENYIGILCGIAPEACSMRGVCGIQYVAEADGSVYPCDFYAMDAYKLGSFLTDDYADFDERRLKIGFIERSDALPETCGVCAYRVVCRGGCFRHRFAAGMGEENGGFLPEDAGQIERRKNFFCESYRVFFAHTIDRMREIAARIGKERII